MKSVILLTLCLLVVVFVHSVPAQPKEKPLTKAILADIVAKKARLGGFVLLTPDDLKGYTLFNIDDPCTTAAPIAFGQTINGTLANTDCRLDDSSYADFYTFNGTQGQQVRIDLSSTAFDTYLGLANDTGTWVLEDDDGGGGTNSRIGAQLPATGVYIILANSVFANTFGDYSLSLTEIIPCNYAIDPTSAEISGSAGTYSFNLTAPAGCGWTTTSTASTWLTATPSSGFGSATINYTVTPNGSGSSRFGVILVASKSFSVTQAQIACVYAIAPTSANIPADGGTFEFTVTTQDGCAFIAYFNNNWLWTTGAAHFGTSNVSYTVEPNNGADRTGTFTVQGQTFTVHQAGRNCSYTVSPLSIRVSPLGQSGTITVDTQPGCTWSLTGGPSWVMPTNPSSGTGPGTVGYQAEPNTAYNLRNSALLFTGANSFYITFSQFGTPYRTGFDFFGDGKADLSLFRPATRQWILHDSQSNSISTYGFGLADDIIVPGDYDGDRKTEVAVFRPSNGTWYFYNSSTNSYSAVAFGTAGDIPAPADFDGDGKTDLAVFRPSTGIWYILRSRDSGTSIFQFGTEGDQPVPADYDGDGRSDVAIWRPSVGEWWLLSSRNGAVSAAQFGTSTDKAVPGDYTGDGKADIAFWRPSTGFWFILRSEDYSYFAFPFGREGDIPVPADYDADGMFDSAVFRPGTSTWWVNRSGSSPMSATFGQSGDVPVPSAFVR